jgi:hypothetical protein
MKKLLVIGNADKNILRILPHIGIEEAGVYAHKHRVNYKSQKKEQAGKEKKVSCSCLSSDKSTAHSRFFLQVDRLPFSGISKHPKLLN